MPVEQFMAGFRSRIDKIAQLNMDVKLKGYLLLPEVRFDSHPKNIIVSPSSGNIDIISTSAPYAKTSGVTLNPIQ